MPVITNAACSPPDVRLDQPFDVEVSVLTATPGPISFHFSIADDLPYFILANKEPTKDLVYKRSFGTAEEHTSRFVLQICRLFPSAAPALLKVTASGLDGTSSPFHIGLVID